MHINTDADINAYKISARKLKQMQEIENIIRDASVDCNLLVNVNYYPKSIFDFNIVLRTSQKKLVLYNFGDVPDKKPKCIEATEIPINAMRIKPITRDDKMQLILPTLLKRMRKYIDNRPNRSYINVDKLIKYIDSNEEVALEAIYKGIYPNKLIDGYMIYPHLGNLVIIPDSKKESIVYLNLPIQREKAVAAAPLAEVVAAPAVEKFMVFFDFDRSDLTIEAADILKKVADNAKAGKVTSIELTGHADRAGSDAYNMKLSQRRANAVKKQLIRLGLPAAEIDTVAKGERPPLLVQTGDGVREPQNRRVEIVYGK